MGAKDLVLTLLQSVTLLALDGTVCWISAGLGAALGGAGRPTKEEHLVTISAGYAGAPHQSPGDLTMLSNT